MFQLNNLEIRKWKRIGVTVSFNNHRLFVGNIPKSKDQDVILEEMKKHARKFRSYTFFMVRYLIFMGQHLFARDIICCLRSRINTYLQTRIGLGNLGPKF